MVRRAVLTPANVYESEVADTLVSGDEQAVYADRAYESKRRRQWLRAQGINDRIMHRANKHQPELTVWQQRRNALIEQRRALVEKVFGTLKRSYRYHRVAYDGLGATASRCGSSSWPTTCAKRTHCLGLRTDRGIRAPRAGPAAQDPAADSPLERRTGLQAVPRPLPRPNIAHYSKVSGGGNPPHRHLRPPP